MKTLLISTHAPSSNTQKLTEACVLGAQAEQLTINIIVKSALATQPEDVLNADAILIGTTENIGYMGGLTKDFFDRCYYPVLDKKQGLPVAVYIRAGLDGTGTIRAIDSIVTGLRWQWVQPPLLLKGEWQQDFNTQVYELAMAMAVGLDAGII